MCCAGRRRRLVTGAPARQPSRRRPAVPVVRRRRATQGAREVLANSVAVLPFANLSPNADDAYFAQGIHEEVLNQLAKLDALSVIARTSVLRYADGKTSLPDIARELNVQTVMEGSVRYAGDNVRITAQLIDPKTGTQLWSDAYQRKFDDIFAIQADIAMNIANALRAEFSIEEQREIERPLTTSPEAYALYLQTRTGRRRPRRRLKLLERAIALDPSFAAAYGRKALIYSPCWRTLASETPFAPRIAPTSSDCCARARSGRWRSIPSELQGRAALGAGRRPAVVLVDSSRAVGAAAPRLHARRGLGSGLEGGRRRRSARERAVGRDRSQY